MIHFSYACLSFGNSSHLRKNSRMRGSPWRWCLLSTMTTIWLMLDVLFVLFQYILIFSRCTCLSYGLRFHYEFLLASDSMWHAPARAERQFNHPSHCFYYTTVMHVMFCNDKYTGLRYVHVGSMCFLTMEHTGLITAYWSKTWLGYVRNVDAENWHVSNCLNMCCTACSCTCCLWDIWFHGF